MKRLVGALGVAGLVGLMASSASAGTITIQLDFEFSGGTAPAGVTPWVEATFVDVVGGVSLTIAATNLTGNEFISAFYFNFNPSLNAALYLPNAPGTGTQTAWSVIGAGNNAWKADGDGFFDFFIDFPTSGSGGGSQRFTAGETFVANIPGAGLTTADFNFASVNGPAGKTGFYAAAHVQGIGPNSDSGWIGAGSPSQVPEPGTMLLLGAGLFGLVAGRRRSS